MLENQHDFFMSPMRHCPGPGGLLPIGDFLQLLKAGTRSIGLHVLAGCFEWPITAAEQGTWTVSQIDRVDPAKVRSSPNAGANVNVPGGHEPYSKIPRCQSLAASSKHHSSKNIHQ